MIDIKVNENKQPMKMYNPPDMLLNYWPEGQVFQQYFNKIPQKDYYISYGMNELSVIHIWFDDDSKSYRLSTNDKKSLVELNQTVLVAPIDANITITLEKK